MWELKLYFCPCAGVLFFFQAKECLTLDTRITPHLLMVMLDVRCGLAGKKAIPIRGQIEPTLDRFVAHFGHNFSSFFLSFSSKSLLRHVFLRVGRRRLAGLFFITKTAKIVSLSFFRVRP